MMPTSKTEVQDTYRHDFRRVANEARRELQEDSEACVDQRNLARPRDDRPGVERGLRIAVTVISVIYRGFMWPELVP